MTGAADPGDGSVQDSQWIAFYEATWAYRSELMEKWIAEGDHHPISLIRRLAAFERRFRVGRNTATGEVGVVPMNYEAVAEPGPAGVPVLLRSSLRGRFMVVPFHSAQTPLADFLVDYIGETGPYDAVIELGCGYGRNLFSIFYGGGPRDIPYFGGELTRSGRELGERLARLDDGYSGGFFAFDHTKPDLSGLPAFQRPLFFTMHSIEQVHWLGQAFFAAVTGAAPRVTCVHLEPFGFQLTNLGEVTTRQRDVALERRWNINLGTAMTKAAQAGLIHVDHVFTEVFLSADPTNPTSLAIWTSPPPP